MRVPWRSGHRRKAAGGETAACFSLPVRFIKRVFRLGAGPGRTQSMNPILLVLLTTAGAFLLHIVMIFVLVPKKKK